MSTVSKGTVGTGSGVSVMALIESATAAAAALATANSTALGAAEARLAEIDAERTTLVEQIASLGGEVASTPTRKGRKPGKSARKSSGTPRASNEMSLREAVAQVLSKASKAATVATIQERVARIYKTSSPNFPQMVAQHLSALAALQVGTKAVAINEPRGFWAAGSGMEAYIADSDKATKIEAE